MHPSCERRSGQATQIVVWSLYVKSNEAGTENQSDQVVVRSKLHPESFQLVHQQVFGFSFAKLIQITLVKHVAPL